MIEARTQKEKLEAYRLAYRAAKAIAESEWHPAWKLFHEYATRRKDGRPLLPSTDASTALPLQGAHHLDDDDLLSVNHIQAIKRTIVASTFNRNPDFSLEPLFPGFGAPRRARLAACALNMTWRQQRFNDPIREAYEDSLDYGRGWVKFGWQSTYTRPVQMGDGVTAKQTMSDALAAINSLSRRGAGLGHRPFTPEEVQQQLEKFGGKLLVEDRPTIRRISPFDMFWDPLATDPADARWIANRWRCPVSFARINPDWSPTARDKLDASGVGDNSQDPEVTPQLGDTGEYQGRDTVWIIDFFDLGEGTWCQFAEQGEEYLRKPSDIPFPFGQPFLWIENIEDTASQQPISEVEVIWPHQRDLTSITKELGRDRVLSRPKAAVRREDAEQLRPLLEASDQGLVVPIDMPPGESTLDAAIKFFKPESNAQTLMAQAGMVTQNMNAASGISDYLRGGGNVGETATEVNAKAVASNNFLGEKASRLRDFIEGAAQRTLMMMQVWSKLPYHMQTKAQDPEDGQVKDATVQFDRRHIAGGYRVIVAADSTEEKTPQAKAARAQAIVSMAVPFIQTGVVDPAQLFRFAMREGFDVTDPTELMTQAAYAPQQPQPQQPGAQPPGAPAPAGAAISGISMTPGSQAGQMGATAALERTAAGDSVPQPEGQ